MTPEELKKSILQLAIQGKLVEQRPEEGTADDLYAQIQEEKQKLINEGKIKKEKPLPDITDDEIPFDIPDNWKWIRLGNMLSIESGNGLTAANMKSGNVPVYGGNGITGYHNEGFVDAGTVVIGRVGFYCGSVHITEVYCWVTDNAFITVYPECCIDKKYLVYILRHLNLGKDNNATAQPVVSGKKIYPKLFPLPPLEEQKRIVAKIEELLPLVDKYADAYNRLEELNKTFPGDLKKSILQYAIQGKLVEQRPEEGTADDLYAQIQAEKQRLIKEGKIKKEKPLPEITDDEIPFDIPDSWQWCRLSSIFDVRDGTHDSPKYVTEGVPFVTSKNLKDGEIDFDNVKYVTRDVANKINERSYVSDGDILFAMIGSIGNPVIVKKDREFCIKNMALFKTYSDSWPMEYLFWYLSFAQYQLRKEASGGVQSFVSLSSFRKYLIPLPPLEEQKRIVKQIDIIQKTSEKFIV